MGVDWLVPWGTPWARTDREAFQARLLVGVAEKGDRVPLRHPRSLGGRIMCVIRRRRQRVVVQDLVRGCPQDVVRPALEHLSDVDDDPARIGRDARPRAIELLGDEAAHFLLADQSEGPVVGVDTAPLLALFRNGVPVAFGVVQEPQILVVPVAERGEVVVVPQAHAAGQRPEDREMEPIVLAEAREHGVAKISVSQGLRWPLVLVCGLALEANVEGLLDVGECGIELFLPHADVPAVRCRVLVGRSEFLLLGQREKRLGLLERFGRRAGCSGGVVARDPVVHNNDKANGAKCVIDFLRHPELLLLRPAAGDPRSHVDDGNIAIVALPVSRGLTARTLVRLGSGDGVRSDRRSAHRGSFYSS